MGLSNPLSDDIFGSGSGSDASNDTSLAPLIGLSGTVKSTRLRKALSAYLVAASAYRAAKPLWVRFRTKTSHTITLDSRDDLYADVMEWLYNTIPEQQRRTLRVSTSASRSDHSPSSPTDRDRAKATLRLHYDGSRSQKVVIDGHKIIVSVESSTDPGRDTEGHFSLKVETITFMAQDVGGRKAVLNFLAQATAARAESGPRLYVASSWGDWIRSGDAPLRDFKTVALPEGVVDDMVDDLERFFSQEKQYLHLGLPWHRGYILQGPPGTGKTTIAKALASRFQLDVYFVSLSSLNNDLSLMTLFSNVPKRSLLLIEDVDITAIATQRTDQTAGPSMSALLQALDGVVSPHGVVTVMTTNRIEALDDALIRTGRMDRTYAIGYLTDYQLTRLIESLVGVHHIFPSVKDLDIAPADVVEVLKTHISDPPSASVDAVELFIKERLTEGSLLK